MEPRNPHHRDDQQREEWRDRLEKDVGTIKDAVIGNEDIGLTGLVNRIANIEKRMRAMDMRIAAVGGGAAVVMYVIEKVLNR